MASSMRRTFVEGQQQIECFDTVFVLRVRMCCLERQCLPWKLTPSCACTIQLDGYIVLHREARQHNSGARHH